MFVLANAVLLFSDVTSDATVLHTIRPYFSIGASALQVLRSCHTPYIYSLFVYCCFDCILYDVSQDDAYRVIEHLDAKTLHCLPQRTCKGPCRTKCNVCSVRR